MSFIHITPIYISRRTRKKKSLEWTVIQETQLSTHRPMQPESLLVFCPDYVVSLRKFVSHTQITFRSSNYDRSLEH